MSAERNYNITELEVAGLIWIVRRTHYMIEAFQISRVIILTNHALLVGVIAKEQFRSSNVNRLNYRLIRISQYLSQFELELRYKLDKKYILSNAIFRLASRAIFKDDGEEILNIYVYIITVQDLIDNSDNSINLFSTVYHLAIIELGIDIK